MKQIILILLLFAAVVSASDKEAYKGVSSELMQKIRITYYSAVEDDTYLDSLKYVIESGFGSDNSKYPAIIYAYVGGYEALKSKHAFWPYTKLSQLNIAMDILDTALAREPESLEIRFMRFSILYFVPSFLGWGEEEEQDAKVIIRLLKKENYTYLDYSTQKGIAEFMINSGYTNETETETLISNIITARQ